MLRKQNLLKHFCDLFKKSNLKTGYLPIWVICVLAWLKTCSCVRNSLCLLANFDDKSRSSKAWVWWVNKDSLVSAYCCPSDECKVDERSLLMNLKDWLHILPGNKSKEESETKQGWQSFLYTKKKNPNHVFLLQVHIHNPSILCVPPSHSVPASVVQRKIKTSICN